LVILIIVSTRFTYLNSSRSSSNFHISPKNPDILIGLPFFSSTICV
jgi:hypothetical protein